MSSIKEILSEYYKSKEYKALEENLKQGCPDLKEMDKALESIQSKIPNEPFTI